MEKRVVGQFRWVAVLLLLVVLPAPLFPLAVEYNRNGECYLMLGSGAFKGVYRLNNPASEGGIAVGLLYNNFNVSIGLSVDLNRNVYSFSESVDPGFTLVAGNIKRQVVDNTVTANQCRWGYHAYEHYDHRDDKATNPNVYRTTGANHSVGPGTVTTAPTSATTAPPPGDTLFGGKTWYEIPNGAWYSTWHTASALGQGYSYKVYRDRVEARYHNWNLFYFKDGMAGAVNQGTVAQSADTRIARRILNGCLDGCGGASGGSNWDAKPMYTSVAFMPPQGGQPSRTYMYSREQTTSNYTISMNSAPYSGTVIGYPGEVGSPIERGTRWIAVSSRSATQDWVYVLGTRAIREWYQMATGMAPPAGMAIDAVAVSNQWNQKGGIIFAYDKTSGIVYKFTRDETSAIPVLATGYEILTLGSDLDDIKADGFGSLYYAKTTATPADPNPQSKFNLDTDVFNVGLDSSSGGLSWGRAYFRQNYVKNVFERNISDGSITSVGTRSIGSKYYAYQFRVPSAAMAGLMTAPYTNFGSRLVASAGIWLGWASALPAYSDTVSPPSQTELGVINVPTPPRVQAFPGYKSHVDIIGPYTAFPPPNQTARHTNQSANLLSPMPTQLSPSTMYFFMTENYPLSDGPQDPTAQTDWNGNGFKGGFITTVTDPTPSGTGGKLFYRWRLWSVQDTFGNVLPPAADPDPAPAAYPTANDNTELYGFYSPVGGKYILTCQVAYDWFNFDLLPYGSMYADRFSCRQLGSLADSQGKATLVNNIKAKFPFMAWATMSTVLNSDIVPDNTWAALAIDVSPNATGTPWATMTASIERCDIPDPTNTWSSHAVHGVFSGRSYKWQMANASQSNLFFNVKTSNDIAVNGAGMPVNLGTFNYVAYQLKTPGKPLYANGDPKLVFKNEVGDIEWVDAGATFEGYIIASMPNNTLKKTGIFGPTGNETVTSIAATYSIGIIPIPTDPMTCKLEIKARRQFKYKVWPYDPIRNLYFRPFWIKNFLIITAQTDVRVIDNQLPRLIESLTTPNNLFGFTGDPIVANTTLDGGRSNPSQLSFTIADDNPWENAPGVNGITDATVLAANRAYNNAYFSPGNGKSSYNLKSAFGKTAPNIGRATKLYFHSVQNLATHTPLVATHTLAHQALYTSLPTHPQSTLNNPAFYVSWTSLNLPDTSGLPYNVATTVSYITHNIDVTNLKFTNQGGTLVNRIPANYANNTPGYQPYPFYVQLTDSSGNTVSATLNTVLNVRDNIAPTLWASLRDRKNESTVTFPVYSAGLATQSLTFFDQTSRPENTYKSVITWTPSPSGTTLGNLGSPGDFAGWVSTPKLLKYLGGDVLTGAAANDADLTLQLKNGTLPGFLEDNVEFQAWAFVSDNSGRATSTLAICYANPLGGVATWTTTSAGDGITGVFRGQPGQYPYANRVFMTATDDGVGWTYRVRATDNNLAWTTNNFKMWPSPSVNMPNTRRFYTTIPVYETKLMIHTIERSLQNR